MDSTGPPTPQQLPFGERPVEPGTLFGILVFFLAAFGAVFWYAGRDRTTTAPAAASAPATTTHTPEYRPPQTGNKPTGADAVNPAMRDFVRQGAREYGVSEEEFRQAFRKGSLKGYSKEEVERVFGK